MTASLGHRIARHATLLGSAYLLARVLDIPFRLYATNILGKVEFGEFGFALSLATFASFAADLGLDQYTTRQIPRMVRDPATGSASLLPGVVRERLRTTAIMAVVFLVIVGILSFFLHDRPGLLLLAVGYSLVLTSLSFCRAVSRGFERMNFEAGAVSIEKVALVAVGLALIAFSATAGALLLAYALSGLLSLAYLFRKLSGACSLEAFKPNRSRENVWKEAWAFGAGALILMALYRTDIILLRLMRGAGDTGLYNTPFLVLEALLLPAQMTSFSILPVLSEGWHQRKPIAGTVSRLLGLFAVLTIPISVGGVMVSRDLMALLFPRFAENLDIMSPTFAILMATFPFICGNYIAGTLLLAVDRQRYNLFCSAGLFLLNLILNLCLIPAFGAPGAAMATLATQGAFFAVLAYGGRDCVNGHIPLRSILSFAGSLLALVCMVQLMSPYHVLWRIMAGAGIYVIVGNLTGIIRISEWRRFLQGSGQSR